MLDKALIAYVDRFKRNFPIFCMMGTPEGEIVQIIERCLRDDRPFRIRLDKNAVY